MWGRLFLADTELTLVDNFVEVDHSEVTKVLGSKCVYCYINNVASDRDPNCDLISDAECTLECTVESQQLEENTEIYGEDDQSLAQGPAPSNILKSFIKS